MATNIRLGIEVDDGDAKGKLQQIQALADTLRAAASKEYKLKFDTAGMDFAAKGLVYLTSSAAKFDAQLKESEAAAKRFSAAIKAQMEAQRDAEKARSGLQSSQNGVDKWIRDQEAASKAFSNALREQMQAEQDYYKAHKDMQSGNDADKWIRDQETAAKDFSNALREMMQAEEDYYNAHRDMRSSETVIDTAIREREAASKAFSNALREQMELEEEANKKAEESAKGWTAFGNAVSVAIGHLVSRATAFVWNKITQGIREAVQEMKNVDTQLTNISKVSGKTGKALADIGNNAYETATKYGESASTYLEAVYAMQKAGMGDQSEAMGELAIKTMLVGDTTQDVATKFLLATNAAWKLEGNMTRLGQIVDEADYINNNYATSLDKLAAGMPIVASVAQNAGMSAEETMAALGTITAATQESGTKAATALRALIMNISKETGKFVTEEGEEFEVTEKSIKSVQGLLEKYAKSELDAAKAAGELINPMTAIRALFNGMAQSDLKDAELFSLLSDMGGKLRTNQLTALVKNFDTLYTDMYEKLPKAAGTADKEIGLMMESWERKTQVLKNTWTKFIADIVNSDTIKTGIEAITDLVSDLDDIVGKIKNPFFDSDTTQKELDNVQKNVNDLQNTLNDLKKNDGSDLAIKSLEKQIELQKELIKLKREESERERKDEAEKLQRKLTEQIKNPFVDPNDPKNLIDTNDKLQLYGMESALGGIQFGGDLKQFQEDVKGIASAFGEYYDNLIKVKQEGQTLTQAQKDFISLYEATQRTVSADGLFLGETIDGWTKVYDEQGRCLGQVKDIATAQREADEERAKAEEERKAASDEYWNNQERQAQLDLEIARGQADIVGGFFSTWIENLTSFYEQFNTGVADAAGGAGDLETAEAGATGEADATAGAVAGIDFSASISGANTLTGALKAAAAAAQSISVGAIGSGVGGHATGTKNAPGGPTLVNELGPELISEKGNAYIANGGRPGIVNLSKGAIVLTARETREALRGGYGTKKAMHSAAGGFRPSSGPSNIAADLSAAAARAEMARLREQNRRLSETSTLTPSVTSTYSGGKKRKGGGGGGFAGDAGPTAEELLEEAAKNLKDTLSNIEKQAKLADNREQYDKEASLYGKGQQEIDKMVAAYKKAGYKETDDEILDLLNKRYDYEKKKDAASKKTIENAAKDLKDKLGVLDKQAKLANTEGDYVKEVKFYEQAQEAIKKMVDMYRKAGYKDDSKEILELLQKNYDYADKQVKVYKDQWNNLIDALESDTEAQEVATKLAEKEQALEDARLALENASKQRTIRTFNASTGQWEWVADQSKIKSAQESLTKAEKDYAEEVKDQAIKELERLRDTMADLNNVVLGPALSAIMLKAESSDEFQNFARSLNAVYGIGSYLGSTQGSSKVLSTKDSHDTIYTFGNVTLTEEQASSMSVAELAKKLRVLKIS